MGEQAQIIYETPSLSLPENSEREITRIVKTWLDYLGLTRGYISLFFCTEETSESLNFQYRNVKKPTDILSWRYEDEPTPTGIPETESPWGELIICPAIVKNQAKDAGISFEDELARLLAHGVTHLRGMDHQTAEQENLMLEAEIELLRQVGMSDIYG